MEEKLLIGKNPDAEYRKGIAVTGEKLTLLLSKIREIVEVNESVWQDILTGAGNTRKVLKTNIQNELEKISIPSFKSELQKKMSLISENLVKGVSNSFALNPSFIPKSYYQVKGNVIVCSDEAENLIKEATNIYISHPDDVQVYELCQQVAPLLTELEKICSKYKCDIISSMYRLGILFKDDNGNYTTSASGIGSFEFARKKMDWEKNRSNN